MTPLDSAAVPPHVVVVGGGPGGYEAALVARSLGAEVTVVEQQGLGGAAVLTDVVPSKTLIATAEWMTIADRAPELGIRMPDDDVDPLSEVDVSLATGGIPVVSAHAAPDSAPAPALSGAGVQAAASAAGTAEKRKHFVDLQAVNKRVLALAQAQSADIRGRLEREGIRIIVGKGRLDGPARVVVELADGSPTVLEADSVLLALGATPRTLPTAVPDGERILTWTQMYNLRELPERLIVVGSGVTGAEFAGAYNALGSDVVLVSSRDRVLPGEDEDAAELLEGVFRSRGMSVLSRSRAASAVRTDDGVEVTLSDGRVVHGSHVLVAVGGVPATSGLGLEEAGVRLSETGHVVVDRVSRTSVRGVYASGDCTGVLPLASVAAMQGRIAMAHALGDAVQPLALRTVASNIFTAPEIATVGYSEEKLRAQNSRYITTTLPLARNPRAKMLGIKDGFVKLFAHPEAGVVLGGVVVAPRASELIFPITLAVQHRLTVENVAHAFTIYPSLSGSIAEGARVLDARVGK
ncbi:NAD(P)H-quinone dehydrogenase [Promicromonospora soli]|uniref:NAD(P)H dehydrogenase (quinone) n=1 Tax=Promicromonospora soli TaxID=2035533 RepID=A0A919G8Y9_9MICO|nr:NAD(P)H-quinone dehydrogenase [Promicromonospora soli]GHH80031.1 NAD(P)H-quinone dehydrogenase [Promicromonospora soli]